MRIIYILIILSSNVFANGVLSNGLEKSINFSMSYKFDNDNLYGQDGSGQAYVQKQLKPKKGHYLTVKLFY